MPFEIHFIIPIVLPLEAGGSPLLQQGERRFSVAERVAFVPLGFSPGGVVFPFGTEFFRSLCNSPAGICVSGAAEDACTN